MRRGRRRAAPAFAGLLALAAAAPASAYSFRDPRFRVIGPEEAPRWLATDRTIRFRLLENDNDDGLAFTGGGSWQDAVRSAMERWNGVSTADIRLVIDPAPARRDWGADDDGMNTIGVSSFPPLVSKPVPLATNSATIRSGFIIGCDIELNRAALVGREVSRRRLEADLLHQLGHCLGLGHTEPFPASLYSLPDYEPDEGLFPDFPDPVMSRGATDARLTADDRAGVSVLYPAPGFAAAYGSVRGELVTVYGDPAAHAFVQTLLLDEDGNARPGPGAFSDAEGRFLVQGVAPGAALLVIHPIVDPWGYFFRTSYNAVRDQWRFTEVRAGEVTESAGPRIRPESRSNRS